MKTLLPRQGDQPWACCCVCLSVFTLICMSVRLLMSYITLLMWGVRCVPFCAVSDTSCVILSIHLHACLYFCWSECMSFHMPVYAHLLPLSSPLFRFFISLFLLSIPFFTSIFYWISSSLSLSHSTFFSPFLLLLPLYYPTLFSSLFIPFSFSRFWTESYAMPRAEVAGSDAHPAVRRLVEMGFAEEDCRQALLTHKGKCLALSLLFLLIIIWLIYIVITLKLHFFLSFVLCVRSFLLSRFIFALIFEFLTCCQFLSSFVSFFLFYLFFVSLLLFFFFPLLHFITPRTLIWFRVLRLPVSPKVMKVQQWKHYWAPCNARQKYIYMNMNRNRNRKGRRKSVRNSREIKDDYGWSVEDNFWCWVG